MKDSGPWTGRSDGMITELRDGQTLAACSRGVVVVSHQDDFAAAFPVGYRLRSDGGTTTVEAFGFGGDER